MPRKAVQAGRRKPANLQPGPLCPTHEWRCIYPNSGTIRFAAYNPHEHTLRIEFQSGNTYDYLKVAEEVFTAMVAAESKGRFFNERIRGKFEGRFVGSRDG